MSSLRFEVVHVCPEGSFRKTLVAEAGVSVADAIELAREACSEFPQEAWSYGAFAIYGKRVEDLTRLISDGDRIEILRPLVMDPAEARRQRSRG